MRICFQLKMLFPALTTLWSLLKCFQVQNCRLFSEKVLDFAVQIYYNKYIIISVEVSKCNTLRQLRQRICVRALRRADAASARRPASQHARQAAVSQISSARIKRKASNSERFRNAAAMAAFFADVRSSSVHWASICFTY